MNNSRIIKLILALIDYGLLYISMAIVLSVRLPNNAYYVQLHRYIFLPLFIVWIIIFYLFDLYNIGIPHQLTRLYSSLILCVIISSLLFYFFPLRFIIAPKTNLALIAVLFTIIHYIFRKLFEYIYVTFMKGHRIMITVSDIVSLELVEKIQNNTYIKYTILGVITTEEYYDRVCKLIEKEKIFTDLSKFETAVKKNKDLHSIIVTGYWLVNLSNILYNIFHRSIVVIKATNFFEQLFHYIPIWGANQYWMMTNINIASQNYYALLKRFLDLLLASVLIIIFSFPMLGIACLIKLCGGKGPILNKQTQLGKHFQLFTHYKFRINTHRTQPLKNVSTNDLTTYLHNMYTHKDTHLTKLGRFLRTTRLDELPQLFNILKGNMSFIGPQPEPLELVKLLTKKIPHYRLRYLIKPGLLGWAQVSNRFGYSIHDFETKLCYDLFYVKNMNIVLDTEIALKTLRTIIMTKGK